MMSAHRTFGWSLQNSRENLPRRFADRLDQVNQSEAKVLVGVVRFT